MIYEAIDLWNTDSLGHKNGFKYLLKIPIGKTFRYFYTQAEVDAYKNRKSGMPDLKSIGQLGKSIFSQSKDKVIPDKKEKDKIEKDKVIPDKTESEVVREEGVDHDGNKYIAKIKVNGYTRYFYSEEELLAYQRQQEYQADEPGFMKDIKEIQRPETAEEALLHVNPNFEKKNEDWQNNCAECTMIYELRRRGYDVESNGTSGIINSKDTIGQVKEFYEMMDYNTDKRFDKCFKGAKINNMKPFEDHGYFHDPDDYSAATKRVTEMIKKNPPNSRGDLSVCWNAGGGHSMVWEMDSKKNIVIKDSQVSGSGKITTYKLEDIVNCSNIYIEGGVQVTRTDNLKLRPGIKKIFKERR